LDFKLKRWKLQEDVGAQWVREMQIPMQMALESSRPFNFSRGLD